MRIVKVPNAEIIAPKGGAFAYKTEPHLPSAHMVSLFIGKRGSGKSVAMTNMVRMLNYDILYCISPTFKSNSLLLKDLNIDPDNVFDNPDDTSCVDEIIKRVEQERDDLEMYLKEKEEFEYLVAMLKRNDGDIPDELLLKFYNGMVFAPPEYKYMDKNGNPRNPFIGLIIDDAQSSKLFSTKKISNLTIKHRHIGAFDTDRASLGLSMFFLVQNYSCKQGGLDRSIRNNCTNAVVFKSKDESELAKISSEMSGEVSKDDFMTAYEYAMTDGDYPFLFVDLHRRKNDHPSMFRSRYDKFICLE